MPPVGPAWERLPAQPPPFPPPPPGDAPPPIRSGPHGLPAVVWSAWEAVLIFIVTNVLIAQTVVGVPLSLALGVTSLDDPNTVYVGLAADLAWLGSMLAWLAVRHRGWWPQLGIVLDGVGVRHLAVGFGMGAVLYLVIAVGVGPALQALLSALSGRESTAPDQLPPDLTGVAVVVSVVFAVLIAPVTEETFFRGILFRSIRDRHGFWPGALISGVLFGLVHFVPSSWEDAVLLQSLMVFTGIGFAWIYERRGSLLATIGAHMAFNTIGITFILWFA